MGRILDKLLQDLVIITRPEISVSPEGKVVYEFKTEEEAEIFHLFVQEEEGYESDREGSIVIVTKSE